jgi:hypothetical protein
MSGDWKCVLTATSSREDVEQAVATHVAECLAEFSRQLDEDPDLTNDDKASLMARAVPIVRAKTRACFEAAWRMLRAEADISSTIH